MSGDERPAPAPEYAVRGYVRYVVLQARGSRDRLTIALVHDDATAFYGYPGDVVYPRSDWVALGAAEIVPLAEYAELEARELDRRWEALQK